MTEQSVRYPQLSIIVAVADEGVIGINNGLPWHLPEDLKRFRSLTMGHHIVMGRKTYESLGRLLPGRTSVILSRQPGFAVAGAITVQSLEQAMQACAGDPEVFVIGGAALYREALACASRLYMTRIQLKVEGDAYFEGFNPEDWQLLRQELHHTDANLAYSYLDYIR